MSVYDDLFGSDNQGGFSPPTVDTGYTSPYVKERGFFGDTASSLGRGVLGLVGKGSHAFETLTGFETGIDEWAKETRETVDFFKQDQSEFYGTDDGFIKKGWRSAMESLPASMGAAAPGAAAGAAIGSVIPGIGTLAGGVAGGLLSTLGLFGVGTYGEAKEEALAQGLSESDAHDYALKHGAIEGGIETLASGAELYTAGLGKFFTRPLASTLKGMLKMNGKDIALAYGKTLGTEVSTEAVQSGLGAATDIQYNMGDTPITEAMVDSIMPSIFMSGIFVTGSQAYNARQKSRIARALQSPDGEVQQSGVDVLYQNIVKQDPELAEGFKSWAEQRIADNKPLAFNMNTVDMMSEVKANEVAKAERFGKRDILGDVDELGARVDQELFGDTPAVDVPELNDEYAAQFEEISNRYRRKANAPEVMEDATVDEDLDAEWKAEAERREQERLFGPPTQARTPEEMEAEKARRQTDPQAEREAKRQEVRAEQEKAKQRADFEMVAEEKAKAKAEEKAKAKADREKKRQENVETRGRTQEEDQLQSFRDIVQEYQDEIITGQKTEQERVQAVENETQMLEAGIGDYPQDVTAALNEIREAKTAEEKEAKLENLRKGITTYEEGLKKEQEEAKAKAEEQAKAKAQEEKVATEGEKFSKELQAQRDSDTYKALVKAKLTPESAEHTEAKKDKVRKGLVKAATIDYNLTDKEALILNKAIRKEVYGVKLTEKESEVLNKIRTFKKEDVVFSPTQKPEAYVSPETPIEEVQAETDTTGAYKATEEAGVKEEAMGEKVLTSASPEDILEAQQEAGKDETLRPTDEQQALADLDQAEVNWEELSETSRQILNPGQKEALRSKVIAEAKLRGKGEGDATVFKEWATKAQNELKNQGLGHLLTDEDVQELHDFVTYKDSSRKYSGKIPFAKTGAKKNVLYSGEFDGRSYIVDAKTKTLSYQDKDGVWHEYKAPEGQDEVVKHLITKANDLAKGKKVKSEKIAEPTVESEYEGMTIDQQVEYDRKQREKERAAEERAEKKAEEAEVEAFEAEMTDDIFEIDEDTGDFKRTGEVDYVGEYDSVQDEVGTEEGELTAEELIAQASVEEALPEAGMTPQEEALEAEKLEKKTKKKKKIKGEKTEVPEGASEPVSPELQQLVDEVRAKQAKGEELTLGDQAILQTANEPIHPPKEVAPESAPAPATTTKPMKVSIVEPGVYDVNGTMIHDGQLVKVEGDVWRAKDKTWGYSLQYIDSKGNTWPLTDVDQARVKTLAEARAQIKELTKDTHPMEPTSAETGVIDFILSEMDKSGKTQGEMIQENTQKISNTVKNRLESGSRVTDGLTLLQEIQNSKSPLTKNLSKLLSIFVDKAKLGDMAVKPISESKSKRTGSHYDPKNHTFYYSQQATDKTIIHEILHGATVREMEVLGPNHRINKSMDKLRLEFYKKVRDQLTDKQAYALQDNAEFISMVLTYPEMQEIMKTIKLPKNQQSKGIKTLWNKFIDSIRRVFDLPTEHYSALEELFSNTAELASMNRNKVVARSNPIVAEYMQEGLTYREATDLVSELGIQDYIGLGKDRRGKGSVTQGDYSSMASKSIAETQAYIDKATQDKATGKEWFGDTLKKAMGSIDKYIEPISRTVEKISPRIHALLLDMEKTINLKNTEAHGKIKGFVTKYKEMSKEEQKVLDLYLLNSNNTEDSKVLKEILRENSMTKEFAQVEDVLKDIWEGYDKAGLNVFNRIDKYFPRKVKDVRGLMAYLRKAKAKAQGKDIAGRQGAFDAILEDPNLSETQKEQQIASLVNSGHDPATALKIPSSTKSRSIKRVKADMAQFYMNPMDALVDTIYEANEAIATRKFVGVDARRGLQNKINADFDKLKKAQEDGDWAKVRKLEDQIAVNRGRVADIEKVSDDSISQFIQEKGKDIPPEDQGILLNALRSRLNQRGMTGGVAKLRDVGLITALGSPLNAITQLGDLVWSLYENGGVNTMKAIFGPKEVTTKDLDMSHVLKEFSQGSTAKWVDKTLKWTGFEWMDQFGKNVNMQAAINKARNTSEADFVKKWSESLTPETAKKVHKDLMQGKTTDDVKHFVFASVSKNQPVSLSEMPQMYLQSGNGRIFYTLKSYGIKALSNVRREIIGNFRKGDKVAGMKGLTTLLPLLVLANASVDELKDFILGRDDAFSDQVWDNLLKLGFASRYTVDKGFRSGSPVATFIKDVLAPPGISTADPFLKDLYNLASSDQESTYKSLTQIPFIGKLAYSKTSEGKTKEGDRQKSQLYKEIRESVTKGNYNDVRKKINRFNKEQRKRGGEIIENKTIRNLKARERKKLRENKT